MRNVFEYYIEDDYLAHHGIKGQKWGIRRFQNPDGTLTEAGKRRLKAFSDYEKIADNSAQRLYKKAEDIQNMNKGMHQRYDGKDGYKHYAEDAYPGSKAEDYGLSSKEFEKWMKTELKSNLVISDIQDKSDFAKYNDAAKAWSDISKTLKEAMTVDPSTISKKDIKAVKKAVAGYNAVAFMSGGSVDLDTLVLQVTTNEEK